MNMQEKPKKEPIVQKILNYVLTFSLAAMVMLVFINAVLRYALKQNIVEAEELSRYFFIWTVYLGTLIAFKENRHVGVDIFISRLEGKMRMFVDLIANTLIIISMLVVTYGGFNYMIVTHSSKGPATGLPFSYISVSLLAASVGIIIMAAQKAYLTLKHKEDN